MNRPGPLSALLEQAQPLLDMEDGSTSKIFYDADAVIDVVGDGSTIMVGGFGGAGFPFALRDALARKRVKDITVVCNNGDFGDLTYQGGLRRIVCSYPTGPTSAAVVEKVESGDIELVVTPQGTLVEQIRSRGAGLGGVLTRTGVGTEFSDRFDIVSLDGTDYILAPALSADVAFVRAAVADTAGNLSCRRASRNFNPVMAMAASFTIAEVDMVVPIGDLDPDLVHIASPFVDRVLLVPPASRANG